MRYAQTMAFTTLLFFSLFTVFNARSDEQSAFIGMFSNKWLWGAIAFFAGLILCLVLSTRVPGAAIATVGGVVFAWYHPR